MEPRHIVLLIADSLRWDTVYQNGAVHTPYLAEHATSFTQARSSGCWTLPATASLFTGLLPHQHGATSQTRNLHSDIPVLPEILREHGYSTHMITANIATTNIFGLERGFDTVDYAWNLITPQHRRINEFLVFIGKPRLRKKIFSPRYLAGQLSSDVKAARVWLQSTVNAIFDNCREKLEHIEKRGGKSFFFLNLMETHFPYHISNVFQFKSRGLIKRAVEAYSMYHLLNQSWLKKDRAYLTEKMLIRLRSRQQEAWDLIAPQIDQFAAELREKYNALLIFGGDHGDNFGEDGWQYHFSNVTDGGNRVPLFWMGPKQEQPNIIETPVSSRHIFQSILKTAGHKAQNLFHLCEAPEKSYTVLESFWYNNQGKTLPKYRFNQFAFLMGTTKYIYRNGRWLFAPITTVVGPERDTELLPESVEPLKEKLGEAEHLQKVEELFQSFLSFSQRVMSLQPDGVRQTF